MKRDASTDFGGHLSRLRKERGLSIREVARRAHLDASSVTRLERGLRTPFPETLRVLAPVFDVPLAEMFAAAGYLTPTDLPKMGTYLRVCYGDLSEEAIASIDSYVRRLIEEHGLDPDGPACLEDELATPLKE